MKPLHLISTLLSASVLSGAAAAEGLYGSADLSATWQDIRERDGSPEDSSESGVGLSGYLGLRFGSAMFVEGELRFQDMSDAPGGVEAMQYSSLAALRAGMDFGAASAEFVVGAAEAQTEEDKSGLTFAGLGGGYALSDQLTLRGMLFHLAHPSGDGEEDVIKDATAISLGAAYGISDRLTIWGDAIYADGVTDDERELSMVKEISLGLDYAFATPGLKAYGAISYADYYQGGEQDNAYDTRVSLGITYSFGAAGSRDNRQRAPLPNIENWMAITSSVVE